MLDIILEDIIKICGEPSKKLSGHTYFMCPYCQDSSKDNLIWTESKRMLKCFADGFHSRMILSEIMKDKKKNIPKSTQKIRQWHLNLEKYFEYMLECNNHLLNSQEALNYLYKHKMITKETVEITNIGFDNKDKKWVIPIFSLKEQRFVGFRYRGWNFKDKKVWCEKDTPSCIAEIYGKSENKNLYICEGEWDAILFAQYIKFCEHSTVYTPSNGCSSLKNVINEINFNNFENIYIIMDMDEVGQKAANEIIKKYPFIIKKDLQFTKKQVEEGYNDFSDWYRLNKFDK